MALQIHVNEHGLKKLRGGHPWIFADEIKNKDALPTRPTLLWFSNNAWFCSPKSYIRLRRIGPPNPYSAKNSKTWADHEPIELIPPFPKDVFNDSSVAFRVMEDWLRYLLAARLYEKSQKMKSPQGKSESCFRWMFSENDYLPGLIIDVFETTLVCQINTAPIDWIWLHLKELIADVFQGYLAEHGDASFKQQPLRIVEMRNASHRKQEGLVVIAPEEAEKKVYSWNGFLWEMAPGGRQKTGAYLDQKDNHLKTAQWAETMKLKTAWDVCSFEGGFALHLLAKGLHIVAVDQSESALEQVRRNATLNSLAESNLETVHKDAFDFLRAQEPTPQVDVIVLDPPSFVKNPKALPPALKGYADLHIEAMKRLNPGGLLVTCSCSHAISEESFKKILTEAAKVSGREFEWLEICGTSYDHQPEPNFPEGRYLQAHFLRCSR